MPEPRPKLVSAETARKLLEGVTPGKWAAVLEEKGRPAWVCRAESVPDPESDDDPENTDFVQVFTGTGPDQTVARIWPEGVRGGRRDELPQMSNAQLIAAAPDLARTVIAQAEQLAAQAEALAWYAEPSRWVQTLDQRILECDPDVLADGGERARKALAGAPQ